MPPTKSIEIWPALLIESRMRQFIRAALFTWNRSVAVPLFAAIVKFLSRHRTVMITCQRSDGGGAQLHGRISAMAFASHFGFSYKSQRIRGAHFASGETWDDDWNALLGLEDQLAPSDYPINKVNSRRELIWVLVKHRINWQSSVLGIEIEAAHWFTDVRPQLLERFALQIRPSFKPPSPLHFEPLVMHLRRGEDLTAQVRFQSDTEILQIVTGLRASFGDEAIRVYTNAPVSYSFTKSLPESVEIDFETDPFHAIAHMAASKGLVIAKSSMSYVAAMMSDGVVFCPKFWHPKLPSWSPLQELTAVLKKVTS